MIDQIMKLVEAGFTADEIRKMVQPASEPAPAPAPAPAPEPAPAPAPAEPEPTPAPEPAPAPAVPKQEPKTDAILQKIDNLTGSITMLLNRSAGTRTPDHTETVDDILAKAFFGKEE